jgi:hypothetical protein
MGGQWPRFPPENIFLGVGTGKKIPPGRLFGNDTVWAVRFGYCRDGYNFFVLIPTYVDTIFVGVFVSCYIRGLGRGVCSARYSGWVPSTYIRILLT